MPRRRYAKSKTLKRRTRTTKKKIKRRYKKYRRLRYSGKKKWYKKWKGKSSIYRFAKSEGLKWSQWISLADFISMPYKEYLSMALAATQTDNTATSYLALGVHPNSAFVQGSNTLISNIVTAFPTDIMNTANCRSSQPFLASCKWKAFNPALTQKLLGPYYQGMIAKYRQYKFVGMQVKYRPTVKVNSPQQAFNYTLDSATGGINRIEEADFRVTSDYQKWQVPILQGLTTEEFGTVNTNATINWVTPPVFRLWINFDKQNYEPLDFCPQCISESHDAYSSTGLTGHSRFKLGRVFNDFGVMMNNGKIKGYDLNKPFKFFVRPYEVMKVYENPSNETVAADYEGALGNTSMPNLLKTFPNSNEGVTLPKRAGWKQLDYILPFYAPPQDGPADGISDAVKGDNCAIYENIMCYDNAFYDPILFGWLLTCDNLNPQQTLAPFGRYNSEINTSIGRHWHDNFRLESWPYLNNLGKFKVTFYMKFRKPKSYQVQPNFSYVVTNAMMEEEQPTVYR